MRPVPDKAEVEAEAAALPAATSSRLPTKVFVPGFLAILLVVALIPTGLNYLDARANSCESLPMPQLRIDGVTYAMTGLEPTMLTEADLGPSVGTIRDGLPAAAQRCGDYTLHDGQGTPPKGTEVRSIIGIDQRDAVATVVGGLVTKFDAMQDGL
jgi:hypothetical protein